MMTQNTPILMICGPTASGKTSWAMALREHAPVEVISADSRQVYRRTNIGTAKPTPEECRRCPHHLIDFLELDEHYSSGQFAADAQNAIRDIQSRNALPVVVGGSGLYLKALSEGLCEVPPVSEEIRNAVHHEYNDIGAETFHSTLREIDPHSAQAIQPEDWKKACRAMEVFRETGQPLSYWQAQKPQTPLYSYWIIQIRHEREGLYQRINSRVEEMVANGLFEEAHRLLDDGANPEWNSLRTVGYAESFAYLRGEINRETCIESIKQHTRNFAKRQLTWFKKARADETLTRLEELLPSLRKAGMRIH